MSVNWRLLGLCAIGLCVVSLAAASQPLLQGFLLQLAGRPVDASAGVLAEHELQLIEQMPPQQQAERLMERAIGRYQGALEQIEARLPGWENKLEYSGNLTSLINTGYDSSDLRIRTASLQLTLTSQKIVRDVRTADDLMEKIKAEPDGRPWRIWTLGLLANRGVAVENTRRFLLEFIKDPNEDTRRWAVNSLAMLGTDDIVEPLLEVFATDASMEVRERAACSLADSGMLSFDQRKKSIPGFLRVLDDPTQNATVHSWVVHALEEISGEHFSANSPAWHNWLARQNF